MRAQALLTRAVGEVDARDLGLRLGAVTTAAWTRNALNLTMREARALTAVGVATRAGMSTTGTAFAAGDITLGHAVAVTRSVSDLPGDVSAEVRERAAAELVGCADRFDAVQLARLGSHILTVVAPEVGEALDAERLEREEARARARRELHLFSDGHGTVLLRGRLTDEAAAVVRAALDPLSVPMPSCADGPDPRTAPQRRADALSELARRSLTGTSTDTDPTTPASDGQTPGRCTTCGSGADDRHTQPAAQVVVTIPLRTLIDGCGAAQLPDGTQLSASAARRMACDCALIPTVPGAESAVLDVGRAQRLFTGARRRALILRDRGCAFPGCDRPPEWCDGHHILHFADGGHTALGNGVLLCGHHHHVVHRDDWVIALASDGVPEFRPPAWIDPERRPQRNHRHR